LPLPLVSDEERGGEAWATGAAELRSVTKVLGVTA
jgi:hypothetical protein